MATNTITIGWGRPTIKVRKVGETTAYDDLPAPVDGTTQLTTTQGDKMEAKIEGGENEAVRYKANAYELAFDVRLAPEKEEKLGVIKDESGIVNDEYSVIVVPENPKAYGVIIHRASVNVQTSFDSTDGAKNTYTFSALKPESGKTVEVREISETDYQATV